MSDDPILTEIDDGLATVTISRPDVMNALSFDAMQQLRDALQSVGEDESVRAVLLQGDPSAGAFSTGADVNELVMAAGTADPAELAEQIDVQLHGIVRALVTMKKPTIAAVDGPAVGAGANIALAADLTYASEDAVFGELFAKIGVAVDSGGSYLLPRLVGMKKAKELAFFGEQVDASEAEEMGMINEAIPAEDYDDRIAELASDLASGPTRALAGSKMLLHYGAENGVDDALEREAWVQAAMFQTEDMEEGVNAFIQDREPEFQGK